VQRKARARRLFYVNVLPTTGRREGPEPAGPGPGRDRASAEAAVTALYTEHALALTRIAYAVLGDLAAAEDAVQDAFSGLFRRWAFLSDPAKAPEYLRSSVLNGCRSALRTAGRRGQAGVGTGQRTGAPCPDTAEAYPHLFADSAEVAVLTAEDRRAVLAALRRLPVRQREALVLRYYLDLPDDEIARTLGVQRSTVRSAVHRGLASLERILRGELS
jgi:RNA polymerase sigma factor (sigma-70 family)